MNLNILLCVLCAAAANFSCNHPTSHTEIHLAATPKPVQAAFTESHEDATVERVKTRMNPDQKVHYTVMYSEKGKREESEYLPDGTEVVKK